MPLNDRSHDWFVVFLFYCFLNGHARVERVGNAGGVGLYFRGVVDVDFSVKIDVGGCGVQFVITDNIGDIFLDQGCVKNRDKPVAVNVADNFVVDIVAFGSSGN